MTKTPFTTRRPPVIPPSVTLDLDDDMQGLLHRAFERAHTGRWPHWRTIAVRRDSNALIELAESDPWRRSTKSPQRFMVLTWFWDESSIGLRWERGELMTRTQAAELFAILRHDARVSQKADACAESAALC